jgi:hypothetical protein
MKPLRTLVGAATLLILGAAAPPTDQILAQDRPTPSRQWQNSPHAGSMDSPAEADRMNRAACARCHTAQGYHREILEGLESSAPYADAVGLTCIACHAEGEAPGQVGPIRTGSARDACRGCHDELVTNQPNSLSWCSQWGIFEAAGGVEFPGEAAEAAAHTGIESGCTGCHMAPAGEGQDPNLVGGHTFRVKTKDPLPQAFNPAGCLDCHGDMTLERITRTQSEVLELLEALSSLLPQRPDPERADHTVPRFPADPSLDEIQRKAAYNYWLVEKDGSLGIHNPVYTRVLLKRTIAALESRKPGS